MKNVTERFFEVLDKMGITASSLCAEIPELTTKQKLSNAKNGRNEIQIEVVSYLCSSRKEINTDYILTGRGDVLIGEHVGQTVDTCSKSEYDHPSNEKEMVFEKLFREKEKELSSLREEKDSKIKMLERRIWELEQELQVFTSRKKTVQEPEDVADAADIMDGMAG